MQEVDWYKIWSARNYRGSSRSEVKSPLAKRRRIHVRSEGDSSSEMKSFDSEVLNDKIISRFLDSFRNMTELKRNSASHSNDKVTSVDNHSSNYGYNYQLAIQEPYSWGQTDVYSTLSYADFSIQDHQGMPSFGDSQPVNSEYVCGGYSTGTSDQYKYGRYNKYSSDKYAYSSSNFNGQKVEDRIPSYTPDYQNEYRTGM